VKDEGRPRDRRPGGGRPDAAGGADMGQALRGHARDVQARREEADGDWLDHRRVDRGRRPDGLLLTPGDFCREAVPVASMTPEVTANIRTRASNHL